MLKHTMVLAVGVLLCGSLVGCGYGSTAGEIADSYGVLNGWGLQISTAALIQSGKADTMVQDGTATIRNRVICTTEGKKLVTEYLVNGEVYRVELRSAIDPTENIGCSRLAYGHIRDDEDKTSISGLELQSLWNALKNNSYDGKAEVAYRSWRGSKDRKTRPMQTAKGELVTEWLNHDTAVDVTVRTRNFPITTMWFRGLLSEGVLKKNLSEAPFRCWNKTERGKFDSRWIMLSPGPGVKCEPFINPTLCDKVRCLQAWNKNQPNQ